MIESIIDSGDILRSKEYIEKSEHIVLTVHVSPDGDAIGAALALSRLLKGRGKDVAIIAPNDFPSFLKWLPAAEEIIVYDGKKDLADVKIRQAELIFCLDYNELKRIGEVSLAVSASGARKIMIDHHPGPSSFCDIIISHPEISSTSELIFRFITDIGFSGRFDFETAECIYTGMMTDTGAFTYSSNYPDIYSIIGELLKYGIDKDEIYDKVFHTYSEDRLRMMGYVLYRKLKIYEPYHTALITLSENEQFQFKRKKGDTEGFVNLPLNLQSVCFSVFMREEKNLLKISFRSKGDFPCNQFARAIFQGGGHKNAAGGEFGGSLEEAVSVFEKALPMYRETLSKLSIDK